jgi:glycosyltransferase involved in cell wall biosynthesis
MEPEVEEAPKAPLFIGMPVFNGGTDVAHAIESLLAQSYRNVRLVISDNGSTDRTPEIARTFAERDSRVRLLRTEHNRGSTWNFNRLLELGINHQYFMWAAHDDSWAPSYVSACLSALDAHPRVALCGTRARFVNSAGVPTGEEDEGTTTIGMDPVKRALKYVEDVNRNSIFYGIYRTQDIQGRRLANMIGGDQAFVFEVSLRGELLTIPEVLLSRGIGGDSRTAASIYRSLGIHRKLPKYLFRLDVYRAFLNAIRSATMLTSAERRSLRRGLLKVGVHRHVLRNLAPRRFYWWIRNGGRAGHLQN